MTLVLELNYAIVHCAFFLNVSDIFLILRDFCQQVILMCEHVGPGVACTRTPSPRWGHLVMVVPISCNCCCAPSMASHACDAECSVQCSASSTTVPVSFWISSIPLALRPSLQAMTALCTGHRTVVDFVMVDSIALGDDSLQLLFFLLLTYMVR